MAGMPSIETKIVDNPNVIGWHLRKSRSQLYDCLSDDQDVSKTLRKYHKLNVMANAPRL
jgi:hypothetical protein